ncbi:MAG: saccharopine dehydrogenase [Actinomycetota bacterium]|nr:saccharopine dehydrogenase [Actinomycetota bacterium]
MSGPSIWIRGEARATERRTPIVPADAAALVRAGCRLSVEESAQRCFEIADYAEAGCQIVPAGSWPDAPLDSLVLGLKELPDEPAELRHRHSYFGHAYKEQEGSQRLLRRFLDGGGELLDLEYLTDDDGRRLAAFGYWAGYLGAALAVLHYRGQLTGPLQSGSREQLDSRLTPVAGADQPTVLVIGALGRSGRGACDALAVAGITATGWDVAETRELDRAALLDHDVLVNTVLVNRPVPPFLRPADVADPARRLRVVSDVTCDVTSPFNVLPIYQQVTSWQQPASRLAADPVLDLIAIDNLPALLPVQASLAFSAELAPQLLRLQEESGPWRNALRSFHDACTSLQLDDEVSDV